jgi:Putative prokaryotic signal transducing protein
MSHPDVPSAPGRLVLAFVAGTMSEGHLAKGLLESEGIPVLVKGEMEGPYRVGPMELWVPEGFEVQARLLLAEARSGIRGFNGRDDPSGGAGPGRT